MHSLILIAVVKQLTIEKLHRQLNSETALFWSIRVLHSPPHQPPTVYFKSISTIIISSNQFVEQLLSAAEPKKEQQAKPIPFNSRYQTDSIIILVHPPPRRRIPSRRDSHSVGQK